MRTMTSLLVLIATVAAASDPVYTVETFPHPTGVPGLEHGSYSALSNSARLAAGYTDPDFDTVGVIQVGNQFKVFRVGTPLQDYTWYWGINDKLTTVGFRTTADARIAGWMRSNTGQVQTYTDPLADVYLYRVNNRDVAVGEVVYDGFWRPAIADKDGLRMVDPPGVALDARAYYAGINDAGAIVGGTTDPDTMEHTCLLWDKHGVTPITHEGASFVAPRAINNKGQVAGYWIEEEFDEAVLDFRRHGFIRERDGTFRTVDVEYPWPPMFVFPEVLVYLDQMTEILDINDRGEILIQATAWYDWDGWVLQTWTYAIATPNS